MFNPLGHVVLFFAHIKDSAINGYLVTIIIIILLLSLLLLQIVATIAVVVWHIFFIYINYWFMVASCRMSDCQFCHSILIYT